MDSNHDARRRSRKGMTRGTSVPNLRNSELEEARPTSSGEEELQLQIALALSQEEASKEEELRKGDDIRLQMALSESKTDTRTPHNRSSAGATGGSSVQGSSLDDLLSLNPPPRSQTAAARSSEPWAGPPASTASGGQPFDPWAPVNASPTPVQTAQNDAWSSPPSYAAATGSLQSPPTRDPWLPVGNTSGDSMSPVSQLTKSPYMQQNGDTGTQSGYDDAWNFDPLAAELPDSKNMNGVQASRRNVKTPESFLGENSALVNLDNLMGPSKPAVPGMPPSSNPFLTSSSSGSQQPNPFLAQQRPSPTINEMRARQSQQQHGGQDEWGLPQPLQPQSQQNSQQVTSTTGPSTNPFL